MSEPADADTKFAVLQDQIAEKYYTDGCQPSTADASFLLGAANMLASLFQAERNSLQTERDGWRAENDRHRSLYVDAVKERDQLRAEIKAMRDTCPHCGDQCLSAKCAAARQRLDKYLEVVDG